MELDDIKPFVRFARLLKIQSCSKFYESYPLDARLFYVEQGEGKIKIDNTTIVMPQHSLLFINSGQSYRLLPCDVVYIAINFDFTDRFRHFEEPIPPVFDGNYQDAEPLENITFSDATCFNKYCFFTDLLSLEINFLNIKNSYERKLPFHRLETSTLLSGIILKIAQKSEKQVSKEGGFDVEKIVEYIHNHYNEEINNSVLSEIFHFHPNYINSKFRKNIGKSLHSYVLETRLLKSIALLESESNSIEEIASECGFNSSNYFARYFRKKIGISPSSYRNSIKQ